MSSWRPLGVFVTLGKFGEAVKIDGVRVAGNGTAYRQPAIGSQKTRSPKGMREERPLNGVTPSGLGQP